jgi:hypothetical protein
MKAASPTALIGVHWLAAAGKGALLGGLASVVFAAELALLSLLEPGGGPDAVRGAIRLMPAVITGAVPVGAVLGMLAHSLRRERLPRLLAASLGGYAAATFLALLQAKAATMDLGALLPLVLFAVAAYLVLAVPPILLTAFTLERWTRPEGRPAARMMRVRSG